MAKLFQMSLTVVFLPLLWTGLQAKGLYAHFIGLNYLFMHYKNALQFFFLKKLSFTLCHVVFVCRICSWQNELIFYCSFKH